MISVTAYIGSDQLVKFLDVFRCQVGQIGILAMIPYLLNRIEAGRVGRHLEIIQRRKESKSKTLATRSDYYRIARGQGHGL